jgi:hypothetical protein
MFGLTFENPLKNNKPIAITNEDEILYISDYKNITKKTPQRFIRNINIEDYDYLFEKFKTRKNKMKKEVHLLLTDPDAIDYITDEKSKEIYKTIREKEKQFKPVTEINLDDGSFTIYPNPNKDVFECISIFGQSGSGKSTIALKYSEQYIKIFPKNNVYLISSLEKDKTLDANKNIIRIDIQSFMIDPPTLDEWENSLVIVDDFETLKYTDIKLFKVIMSLVAQLVSKGRHKNIRTIVIKHDFSNSGDKIGGLIISESTHYILYPKTCSRDNMNLIFGKKGTLTKKQIDNLYTLPTRWVAYIKNFPPYIITENQCWLL